MDIGKHYGRTVPRPIQFKVTQEELISIDQEVAALLGESAWLTTMSYHGDLADLTKDLKIGWISPNPKLVFDSYRSRCASEQKSQAIIGTFGSTIVAYGVVITPTPCYELEAGLDIPPTFAYPPTIIVDITSQEKPGLCIVCLGEVPFQAKIMGLAPGTYDVVIQYQDKVIGQERVFLPLSSVFSPPSSIVPCFELPSQATLKVHTPQGGFTVYVESNSDIEVLNPNVIVRAKLRGSDMKLYIAYLQFNEISTEAMVEVNDVPVVVKISPSCGLRIENSQLFLDARCLLPVRVMPDQVASTLKAEPEYLELKVVDDKAIYEFKGVSHQKILGLVPIEIKSEAQADATTGEIIKEETPWWAMFCW